MIKCSDYDQDISHVDENAESRVVIRHTSEPASLSKDANVLPSNLTVKFSSDDSLVRWHDCITA